jgi:hypothetical protein
MFLIVLYVFYTKNNKNSTRTESREREREKKGGRRETKNILFE